MWHLVAVLSQNQAEHQQHQLPVQTNPPPKKKNRTGQRRVGKGNELWGGIPRRSAELFQELVRLKERGVAKVGHLGSPATSVAVSRNDVA